MAGWRELSYSLCKFANRWGAFHLIRVQELYLTEWLSCSERKVWIAETFLWLCCVHALFVYLDVTSFDKGITLKGIKRRDVMCVCCMYVCVCVCVYIYIYIKRLSVCEYIYIYIYKASVSMSVCMCVCVYTQGVTGGTDQTSGECSLC